MAPGNNHQKNESGKKSFTVILFDTFYGAGNQKLYHISGRQRLAHLLAVGRSNSYIIQKKNIYWFEMISEAQTVSFGLILHNPALRISGSKHGH